MKVAVVCRSDSTGGAAVVSRRLTEALRAEGADASMLVMQKESPAPFVHAAGHRFRGRLSFLAERLRIFLSNGFNRRDLFKVDTAEFGLPLWKNPVISDADVVILNWVNQGMLSLKGVEEIIKSGKRVIWVMHDMWPLTGICHHSFGCTRYRGECGDCPFLGRCASPGDLSHKVWRRKKRLYASRGIRFVAVSRWLADKAQESSLLNDMEVSVIPNAFNFEAIPEDEKRDGRKKILFVAATLDNWIKGLDVFKEALHDFTRRHPEMAADCEVVMVGEMKDRRNLEGFPLPVDYRGRVDSEEELRRIFASSHVTVSSSEFESFGATLVEGQMAGSVPVAFDRGGQSDIIDHLSTGYLAEWDDDPTRRAERIGAGIAWALNATDETRLRMRLLAEKRFSYPAVARKMIEVSENR